MIGKSLSISLVVPPGPNGLFAKGRGSSRELIRAVLLPSPEKPGLLSTIKKEGIF
jgi:hypothetical protein